MARQTHRETFQIIPPLPLNFRYRLSYNRCAVEVDRLIGTNLEREEARCSDSSMP